MKIIIETRRLLMAAFEKSDAGLLFQLTGNPEVMKFFPKTLSYAETVEMTHKIVNQYDQHGYSFWKLLLKADKEFVGMAGLLHQVVDGRAETEISYRIMPNHWNRGLATEAARACKDYAESVLDKQKLISIIHPGNEASQRVALKLGARKSKHITFLGTGHDVHVYMPRQAPPPHRQGCPASGHRGDNPGR